MSSKLEYASSHAVNDVPTLDDMDGWLGIPRQIAATAFEIVCGWSIAGAVFYDITITALCCQSV